MNLPTLADIPRDQWPPGLIVRPPNPTVEGHWETVQCKNCHRPVPVEEMIDLRALPATVAPGLPRVLCAACQHHHYHVKNVVTHEAMARALGATPAHVAACQESDRQNARFGFVHRRGQP